MARGGRATSSRNGTALQAQLDRARALLADGLPAEALALIEDIERRNGPGALLHDLMSDALMDLGEPAKALGRRLQAYALDPRPERTFYLGVCLRQLTFSGYSAPAAGLYARALRDGWARARELSAPCLLLLKRHPDIRAFLDLGDEASLANMPLALLESPAMLWVLRLAPTIDSEFEAVLRAVRLSALIRLAEGGGFEAAELDFLGALVEQMFLNEYVYDRQPAEEAVVEGLVEVAEAELAKGRLPAVELLLGCALYRPLASLRFHAALEEADAAPVLRRVVVQQLLEPRQERELAAGIASMSSISDDVSVTVRQQYEENPYPRWTTTARHQPRRNLEAYLARTFPSVRLRPIPKPKGLPVLVAGCGTGLHALDVAARHPDSAVLAIDLSRASLAYAARKAQEYGIANLVLQHGDILALNGLPARFHLIECGGVLHHMRDPEQGLRALDSVLLPGGVMKIAVYSELGRQDVVAARALAAEMGCGGDLAEIRRIREAIRGRADHPARALLGLQDFYAASEFRDLVLHVQEHRFTVPRIEAALGGTGLRFLGFEVEPHVGEAYARRFPEDAARTELANWQAFETDNPHIFRRMYHFWVQKPTSRPAPAPAGALERGARKV